MAISPMHQLIQQLRSAALLGQYAELTDGQLLDGLVAGRAEGALDVLVRRHAQMVWAVCHRVLGNHHDAEDAFQAAFLVFVHKATSISPRAKVGNWLYGVACQTALNARRHRAKRQRREMNMVALPETAMAEQASRNDLQAVLDEELSRLPEKYRTAIVLCDLEGRTRSDAARQLGLPEGTVAAWLARARKMLAKRLHRASPPGVFSAGALAMLLAQNAAVTAAPRSLIDLTIQAAKLVVAGQNASGVALPGALALTQGVIRAMLISQCIKFATLLLMPLALTVLVVGAGQTGPSPRFPETQPSLSVAVSAPALPTAPNEQQAKPGPKALGGFDAATVAAWTKAGAQVGWMGISDAGYLVFDTRPDSLAAAVPAFRFLKWQENLFPGLPAPAVSFGLDLRYTNVTDAELKELARFKSLQMLNLQETRVTDAGLKELAGLKSLQALNLSYTNVRDAGLKELAGLKSLQALTLRSQYLTDAGLKELAGLKNLQMLDLQETRVTDAGLKEFLAGLKSLQKLNLNCQLVADAGLKELAGLKSLQTLSLQATQVTDAGLKELAGLQSLQTLNLQSAGGVTDAGLKELAGLKSLQTLNLFNTPVTGSGLKELAGLKSLQTLILSWTRVTGAGLKELAGLKSLQTLDLGFTRVTDAGLKEVASLQSLQTLNLQRTQVTDAGVKELAGLKSLKMLELAETPVTDVGVKELTVLQSLQTLSLQATKVTDAGLKELAGLKSLQTLNLAGTKVTDAGLKELAGLTSLQTLRLGSTRVTDAGLKELAGLTSLQTLGLHNTQVTDAGLKELAGLKSLLTLDLGRTKVTDAGLKELAGLKSLQSLDLGFTQVTNAGVAELQKALPACSIGRGPEGGRFPRILP